MNIASYFKELHYALSQACDWRSRMSLIRATVGFHLANAFRQPTSLRGNPINIKVRVGSRITPLRLRPSAGDIFILYEVLAFESYKIDETDVAPASVRTIVDCGANIGLTALYFAERYPNARIISVEPDPANFKILQANVADEPRITPVQAAVVGESTSIVYLAQSRPAWGNSISDEVAGTGSIAVRAATIPELQEMFDLQRIDLLKVDIEGAEERLFAKPSFLRYVDFVVIELHGDYTQQRFESDVQSMGFAVRPPGVHGVRAFTAYPAS